MRNIKHPGLWVPGSLLRNAPGVGAITVNMSFR
jgi:hypothetical protein